MKLRHPFGVVIDQGEARLFATLMEPRFRTFVVFQGLMCGLIVPVPEAETYTLWGEIAFWALATVLFVPAYILSNIIGVRIVALSGGRTMWEVLAMASTLLMILPILLFSAPRLGLDVHSFVDMLFISVPSFLLLEVSSFIFYLYVQAMLFPEIKPPGSKDTDSDFIGDDIFLQGTSIPLTRIEVISAMDGKTDVQGRGQIETVPLSFNAVVARLPGYLGFQIHRSLWVSRRVAMTLQKDDRGRFVTTRDGRRLPVARSRQTELETWIRQYEEVGYHRKKP